MLSRRAFLGVSAAAASGTVAVACGKDEQEQQREERTAADREIVKYLLRLERIESAFWNEVVQRGALDETDAKTLAADIARNERVHVDTLERYARRLGADAEPVTTAFGDTFGAGADEVLATGATLENLAAAAYLGQINRIQDKNLLASLLAIHSVEGRQAAATNRLAGRGFSLGTGRLEGAFPDGAFAEPMSMQDVRDRLKRYAA